MHTEKIQKLEKALQNPQATAEMKAKFQAAIDKLKAEAKPVEKVVEEVKTAAEKIAKLEPAWAKLKGKITIQKAAETVGFKYQTVKKVDYKLEPGDAGLKTILQNFAGDDRLRPVMSAFNFDDAGVTATNAHILIHIAGKPEKKGLFHADGKPLVLEKDAYTTKYPLYDRVVPTRNQSVYKVDVAELYNYTRLALKSRIANQTTHQVTMAYTADGEKTKIGANLNFLQIITKALQQISSNDDWHVHMSTPNRALVFTNHNKTINPLDDTYTLLMPVIVTDNEPYGIEDTDFEKSMEAHWDFKENAVVQNGKIIDLKTLTEKEIGQKVSKKQQPKKQKKKIAPDFAINDFVKEISGNAQGFIYELSTSKKQFRLKDEYDNKELKWFDASKFKKAAAPKVETPEPVKQPAPKPGKEHRFTKTERELAEEGAAKEITRLTQVAQSMGRAEVLEAAQDFQKKYRSLYAQATDKAGDSKNRLTPTPENLLRWMKNPGKFDLIGVDTYKKDDATADLKIKQSIFWHRLGIK